MAKATRQHILQVAMELFAQKGFGATTIEDILQATQLRRGSLYYLFHTKRDLLMAVLKAYRDGTRAKFEAAAAGAEDPVAQIFCFLNTYRDTLVASDFCVGSPVASLSLELHEVDIQVQALIAQSLLAAIHVVNRALCNRFPPPTAKQPLAEFIQSVVEGATLLARAHRDIGYFDRSIAQLRDYIAMLETKAGVSIS